MSVDSIAGTYSVKAELKDAQQKVCARGQDRTVAVDWNKDELAGKGAYYGNQNDKVAAFYQKETGKELPAFTPQLERLDWVVVNRSSLDEPVLITPNYFQGKDGKSTLKINWYGDNDMRSLAATKHDVEINRTFTGGAQPDESVSANQAFSVVW